MRNVIWVLALLCLIHVSKQDLLDPTANLERLVNLQKKATEFLLNKLVFLDKQTRQNFELKINDIKADTLLNVNKLINEAFENVNSSIEKGKKEGKNVDECYDYAKTNLETKNENANAELEKCIDTANRTISVPLSNVRKVIEQVKTLMNEIDAVIPTCRGESSGIIKLQACVMKNLYVHGKSLKGLNADADMIMKNTLFLYARAITDAKSCTTKLISNTRTFGVDIIVRTDNCVRNAPTDNSTSIY
ncbi:hypothetical protein DMN91_006863 [Ooceraea biroi]|uniref:Protein TsetseEP domain-containing protein n=1 Tax=Ooceraea biroi TaxID=2015173 RepID=A0A026W5X5_OOCBI|nr:uncharacterized protein LOC105282829 [Ooceraea biroi]EZA51408.1 hypothetical protein X777_09677 [Ooceraea biroi]RLU20256.1 hypothetical protein DMN91_006863 [Ooceraea biroi]